MNMNEILDKYNITEDVRFMEAFLQEHYCYPLDIEEYLRDWYEAKSKFLFDLFGGKVTIDCGNINFKKSYSEIEDEMYKDRELSQNLNILMGIIHKLLTKTLGENKEEKRFKWVEFSHENQCFVNTLENCLCFRNLYYNGSTIHTKQRAKFITNDDRVEYVYIQEHQKIGKILNNFYKAVGKVFPAKYDFELAQARELTNRVLAQVSMYAGRAKISGKLYLSIHPFDYITMSQNACNWQSCMVLEGKYGETGDYCAGTVAMMNSKNAIIAYLDADTPYYPCSQGEFADKTWNNKKYRNIIIVDPLLISTVKGYPSTREDIDSVIIEKLRTLALENMGWIFEKGIKTDKYRFDFTEKKPIQLYTIHMYNDSEYYPAQYISGDLFNLKITTSTARDCGNYWDMCYDGPVKCLECHGDIGESTHPRCYSCRGLYTCDHCGGTIVDEGDTIWVGDNCYCRYCYDEYFFECPCCNEIVEEEPRTGELGNVEIFVIAESKDFKENVKVYYEKMSMWKKSDQDPFYRPFKPSRFLVSSAARICKNCLKEAIDKGYVEWKEFFDENTKLFKDQFFFLTNKAVSDEDFLEKIAFYEDDYSFKTIGYEEYCAELANMEPIEELDD